MKKPNILLITSDQQHWSTLGFLNPKIKTPNLDRLFREGTNFSRAYCPNPTCTPTRASIITGQYPSLHGAWTLGTHLREDAPTVGHELSRAGYYTALVGKAHFQALGNTPEYPSIESQPTLRNLDFWREFHGPWYGFQNVETARMHADEYHAGGHYGVWMEDNGLVNWRDYFQDYPPNPAKPPRYGAWDLPEEFHYNNWTSQRTIAQFDAAGDSPFFVWSSFHDPHPPYLVPEPWASMYDPADMEIGTLEDGELEKLPPHFGMTQEEKPDFSAYKESGFSTHGMHSHLADEAKARRNLALYFGMISFMDAHIGCILDALDERGLTENTLVVFSTDHGHFFGQHGLWAKGPFHFEDEIRVPFLVRWPGQVSAGHHNEALQSLVDLAPTFLAAAGLPIPGRMQGLNQLPTWQGSEEEPVRDHAIIEFRHEPTTIHLRTFVTARWKLTVYRDRDYGELFDLQNDPQERCNLWNDDSYATVKANLFQQWINAELRREPMEMPRISGA